MNLNKVQRQFDFTEAVLLLKSCSVKFSNNFFFSLGNFTGNENVTVKKCGGMLVKKQLTFCDAAGSLFKRHSVDHVPLCLVALLGFKQLLGPPVRALVPFHDRTGVLTKHNSNYLLG